MILNHPELVPDLALLHPSFTAGMPPKLTALPGTVTVGFSFCVIFEIILAKNIPLPIELFFYSG